MLSSAEEVQPRSPTCSVFNCGIALIHHASAHQRVRMFPKRCWEFESTINELVAKLVNNCHESSLKSNRGSWGRKQEVTSTSSHAELIALYKLKQNHYVFCCTCDSFFQEFDETLQCLASLKARLMWKNLPLPTFKFLLLRSKLFLWDLVDGWDRHNQTFKISNHMPT